MSKRRKLTWPRKKVSVLDEKQEKLRKRKAHKPQRVERRSESIED